MNRQQKTIAQMVEDENRRLSAAAAAGETKVFSLDRRREQRWRFRRYNVELEVQQAGGTFARLVVTTQDLSSRGLGFVHTSLLFAKATCNVTLTREGAEPYLVEGRIAHCKPMENGTYQVGVLFNHRVDEAVLNSVAPLPEAA